MSINLTTMQKSHNDQGIQRPKLAIDDAGQYTGNQTLYMAWPMRELLIVNDDTASLTVTITSDNASYSVAFTLLPGEVLDERFYPFTQIDVVATGYWRYIVRSGKVS